MMRLVHIAAGAGTMYCGACAHDVALVRGMMRRGHEVTLTPLYTPLKLDSDGPLPKTRVYMGGINAYLQQRFALFRHSPGFLDRLLDNERLLRWASNFAVKTNPADLGPMTVSVLQGMHGRQRNELEKLLGFLESQPEPDLVTITNSLLSGLAPVLKERLGAPVVCLLQGEDSFVEALPEPYRGQAQDLMRRNAASIDLFLAPSSANAGKMTEFLELSPDKLRVVKVGIDAGPFATDRELVRTSCKLGYLSVVSPPKGLDMLVDAFIALADDYPDLQLWVAGQPLNKSYLLKQTRKIERLGLDRRFIYRGEFTFPEKVDFLQRCDFYCLPSRIDESRGVAVLEAMASGLPVVVPNAGVFPEILTATGGGVLFEPRNLDSLTASLRLLLDDQIAAKAMGLRGAEGVAAHYCADRMVAETEAEYLRITSTA
jgi:glycosyltransferase involved in cell wall biosynthesis